MSLPANVFILRTFSPLMNQVLDTSRLKDYHKKAEILCNTLLPVGIGTLFSRLLHKV